MTDSAPMNRTTIKIGQVSNEKSACWGSALVRTGVDLGSPVIAQLAQDKITSFFDLGVKTLVSGLGPKLRTEAEHCRRSERYCSRG